MTSKLRAGTQSRAQAHNMIQFRRSHIRHGLFSREGYFIFASAPAARVRYFILMDEHAASVGVIFAHNDWFTGERAPADDAYRARARGRDVSRERT
ncbi:MAG: hypothetical protein M0R66_07755 [Candidatus Omnitrophica bacterium]|nr:hypothetical protein [Candidatus Omnitrophota bacterium]